MFEEPVEAVIFDMDGTLIDSEAVYIAGMQEAAKTLGLPLPIELCHAMVGVPSHECNLMLRGTTARASTSRSFAATSRAACNAG